MLLETKLDIVNLVKANLVRTNVVRTIFACTIIVRTKVVRTKVLSTKVVRTNFVGLSNHCLHSRIFVKKSTIFESTFDVVPLKRRLKRCKKTSLKLFKISLKTL